jgi:hypothetical protein
MKFQFNARHVISFEMVWKVLVDAEAVWNGMLCLK